MSVSAYQNDRATYALTATSNASGVTTKTVLVDGKYAVVGASLRSESVSSQTDITVQPSLVTGSVWSYSLVKFDNASEFSERSTNTEGLEWQNDPYHLNVPVHEFDEHEVVAKKEEEQHEQQQNLPPSTSAVGEIEESEPDAEIDIQIRNVVCNYTLPLHIDLHRVALNCGNVLFDRGRGVLLKQKRNPSCYVKIYSSGKVYIVGCRSESECKRAARGVARMVQRTMGRLSDVIRIRSYRICNLLATCKMPFGIKIEELAQKYPECSQYEPELSVGLIWRSTDPRATLRIHTTGSITVTGAASEADVVKAVEIIYPIVKEFRCDLRTRTNGVRRAHKRVPANLDIKRPRMSMQPDAQEMRRYAGVSGVFGNKIHFSDEEEDEFEDV